MRNFHHTENGKEVTTEISDEMRFLPRIIISFLKQSLMKNCNALLIVNYFELPEKMSKKLPLLV